MQNVMKFWTLLHSRELDFLSLARVRVWGQVRVRVRVGKFQTKDCDSWP